MTMCADESEACLVVAEKLAAMGTAEVFAARREPADFEAFDRPMSALAARAAQCRSAGLPWHRI
jgi:hypothetical protein